MVFIVSFCVSAKEIFSRRLSRPLIGNDGKVYACSEKDLLAFESNGSIAWTLHLNYTCKFDVPPIHGGKGKVCNFLDISCVIDKNNKWG